MIWPATRNSNNTKQEVTVKVTATLATVLHSLLLSAQSDEEFRRLTCWCFCLISWGYIAVLSLCCFFVSLGNEDSCFLEYVVTDVSMKPGAFICMGQAQLLTLRGDRSSQLYRWENLRCRTVNVCAVTLVDVAYRVFVFVLLARRVVCSTDRPLP